MSEASQLIALIDAGNLAEFEQLLDEKDFDLTKDDLADVINKIFESDTALLKKVFLKFKIVHDDWCYKQNCSKLYTSFYERAAFHGRMDTMDLFIEMGYKPSRDQRPLHHACIGVNIDMVQRLLSEGFDPNQRINEPDLGYNTVRLKYPPYYMRLENPTPLHMLAIAKFTTDRRYETAQIGIAHTLLAHGANPLMIDDLIDLDLPTLPIHVAAIYNCVKLVELLINHSGVEQLYVGQNDDENGNFTPFKHALECGHIDVIKVILEHPSVQKYDFVSKDLFKCDAFWALRTADRQYLYDKL